MFGANSFLLSCIGAIVSNYLIDHFVLGLLSEGCNRLRRHESDVFLFDLSLYSGKETLPLFLIAMVFI